MSESMGGIISECPGDFIGIGITARLKPKKEPQLCRRGSKHEPEMLGGNAGFECC
jgi:hypothetical protein